MLQITRHVHKYVFVRSSYNYVAYSLKPDPHILSIVVFQAHMEAVHADWKEYLNLLICEENHLKHMDEYHKVRNRANEHLQRFKAHQNR